jgi:ABC-type glycerol-3-phosphate transport system substrate-binding protein
MLKKTLHFSAVLKVSAIIAALFVAGSTNLFARGRSQDSGQTGQTGQQQAATEKEVLPEGIVLPAKTIDLGGFELKIGSTSDGSYWFYDPPQNDLDVRINTARRKVMQDNNFTYKWVNCGTPEELLEAVALSIMAGNPLAHVYPMSMTQAVTLFKQDLLAPVSPNNVIQFNEVGPYWNHTAMDIFSRDGKIYAYSHSSGTGSRSAIYWNKRLFSEAGIDPELPYQLQRAETWTWDAFEELARKLNRDTNNDGIIDINAISYDAAILLDAVVFTNGAQFVDKAANGSYVSSLQRPEFTQAIQFYTRLINERLTVPRSALITDSAEYTKLFFEGKAAMLVGQMGISEYGFTMPDDWGMVVFPKGPNAKVYHSGLSAGSVIVIPKTYTSAEVDKILWADYCQEVTEWELTPREYMTVLYPRYRDPYAIDETYHYYMQANGAEKPRPGYLVYRNHTLIPGLDLTELIDGLYAPSLNLNQLISTVTTRWATTISEFNTR